jgi:hypothetical protein
MTVSMRPDRFGAIDALASDATITFARFQIKHAVCKIYETNDTRLKDWGRGGSTANATPGTDVTP